MAVKPLPSRELVRQLLDYNAATGDFTWLPRGPEMFSHIKAFRIWNARYSGKLAGHITENGYLIVRLYPTVFMAHRLAWLLVYGEPVPEIDHIDRDRSNNRIANLRAATRGQNRANSGTSKNSTTGVKGVNAHKNRFHARIMHNGDAIHLGSFRTVQEAAEARRKAAERLHGEFTRHE
jgi:hypothetical protein